MARSAWIRVASVVAIVLVAAIVVDPAFAGNRRRGRRTGGRTAAGAALAGEARLLAAQAQANATNAQSAEQLENAKAMERENRLRRAQQSLRMRQANQLRQAAEHPDSTDAAAIASRGVPPRLDAIEFDPDTGIIAYPPVLTDSPFDEVRAGVDDLFGVRAEQGSLDAADREKLESLLDQFRSDLRSRIDAYPSADYGHAATFLDRLRHEARHAAPPPR